MRIVLVALGLILAGCAMPGALPAIRPVLARAEAERLAMRADDLLSAALAGQSAEPLADVFRGSTLTALRLQVARFAARGVRIEERDAIRRLVAFDAIAAEGLLAVNAEHRLATAEDTDPPWAATERRWWMRFAHEAGRWWIVDQRNLPPDQWVVT